LAQPFAQAKNGDKQFWKQKFYATNEKAQHTLMRGPIFFRFMEGGGGIFNFFLLFPMCSHDILLGFLLDSPRVHQVPNLFPKETQ
jgi:hypothetical protein